MRALGATENENEPSLRTVLLRPVSQPPFLARLRWVTEPDDGMYDAINKGLVMATGEIVAYLNSDDFYPSWAVASVVEFFERNPDVGLVYGDYIRVDLYATDRGAVLGELTSYSNSGTGFTEFASVIMSQAWEIFGEQRRS